MEVGIYLKSRFRGNPKGGGEAAVVEYIDGAGTSHTRTRSVRVGRDTKNALYLKAIVDALRILTKPCHVTIYTDCAYIGGAVRMGWVEKWQRDGWRKADGTPPANVEDWKQFHMMTRLHSVAFAGYDGRHDGTLGDMLGGHQLRLDDAAGTEPLTYAIAREYRDRAAALPDNGMQYAGERRALGEELRARCGVTELEAANILAGYHIGDYCAKYRAKGMGPPPDEAVPQGRRARRRERREIY